LLETIKAQTKTKLTVLRKALSSVARERRAAAGRNKGPALLLDRFGDPLSLETNGIALVRHKLGSMFALDEFAQVPMVMRAPPWARPRDTYPRPITDADDAAMLAWVQRQGVHLRGRPAIRTVMAEIIRDTTYHPVRQYLDSLKWDSTPRLDRWLITYAGAAEKNYTTVVGSKWMISAVARIYQPGCIAKYCLLLLGPQDLGKSTALRVLGGDWFTDDIAQIGTKDAAMQNAGVWIVELAELASTTKAHIDAVKAFISRPVDRFRLPYGTYVDARPRQSVLSGTVNPSGAFLKDDTGAVRFWPVTCTAIALDMLRRDRDQLWAEAVHRSAGEHWWLEDDAIIDAAREEQASHSEMVEDHPWFPIIEEWLAEKARVINPDRLRQGDRTFVFTMAEILKEALEIPKERMTDPRVAAQVGKILRCLGWKSGSVRLVSFEKGREDLPVRRWQKAGTP